MLFTPRSLCSPFFFFLKSNVITRWREMKWGVCVPVSVFALQWLSCCGVTGSSLLPVVLPNVVFHTDLDVFLFFVSLFLFMGSLDRVVHYYNKFHVWLQQLFDCILKIKPVKIKICFKLKKKKIQVAHVDWCVICSRQVLLVVRLSAPLVSCHEAHKSPRQTFQKTL